MGYIRKQLLEISDFEIKRQEIWRTLSSIYDSNNEIIDSAKYKNKEAILGYLCKKFDLSRSQIKRLIIKFHQANGKDGCINFIKHQNSFKTPHNKTNQEKIDNILNNFKQFYNNSLTIDKNGQEVYIPFTLRDYYCYANPTVSYNCLRQILIANNIIWSFAYRSTKKKVKFNLETNKVKDEKFIKLVNQALNYRLTKHTKQIKKQYLFGEIVEIDGCDHIWIPEIGKCNILATVDASTGMMLSASLDWQETNNNYAHAIFNLIQKHGLPQRIYGDKRRSIFSDGINQTKITKPLTNLGVIVKCESFAQHKPNVEASWKLLQQSLPIFLHNKKIKKFEEFKEFVSNDLCDWFNKRFNRKQTTLNAFNYVDPELFKNSFCVSQSRKVRSGNYIEINNGYYAPFNTNNQRVAMKEKGYVNVYENLNPEHNDGIYIKRGSERFYLKPIDVLTETIDWNLIDPGTALDDKDEIIINLKDELISLKEENDKLKLICKESGIIY